jgi:hypothetical protein
MNVTAERVAGFPGERFRFEARLGRDVSRNDVGWTGGGTPATGTGPTFSTTFGTGGTYVVSTRSGDDHAGVTVTVCPIERWLAEAEAFYGPAIDFSRVKVGSSRLVLGSAGTAWTCNDVIRFKRPRRPEDLPHESTLIHELGHVWEHQTGQAQLLRGAWEQIGRRFGRDPYDFGGPDGVRRAAALASFTKEGQAQILTELWRSRHGAASDHRGVPFSTPGYTDDLERLASDAGIGRERSGRRGPWGTVDGAVARIVNLVMGSVPWPPSSGADAPSR